MTITTNALVEFYGTQDAADDGATQAISDAAFSVDVVTWTNDDDAPSAYFTMKFQYPSGTLNAAPYVGIYARRLNVDGGTADEAVPDAAFPHVFLGAMPVDTNLAATTDTQIGALVGLPNSKSGQEYEFYYENQTGVTMSATWVSKITPLTVGPHA